MEKRKYDKLIPKYQTAIRSMREGKFGLSVPVDLNDEIGKLGQELNELARELERKFNEAIKVQEISEEITAGLFLHDVLNRAFDSFHSVIPYNRMGCALLNDENKIATAYWDRTDAPRIMLKAGYTAAMAGSSLQQILETGKPRILNDLEAYLAEHPASASTKLLVAEGMRSNLTCPLIAQGKPVGFLFFTSREKNTYQDIHQDIFLRIAGQISILVEKSQLYQQLYELNQALLLARRGEAESERHFRAITETANDAIITGTAAGNIIGWNAAAERLFGYTEAEIIGQPLTVLIPERFRGLHSAGLARVAAGGAPHIIGKIVEVAGLRKDGSEFPLELSLAQWQAAEGKFFNGIIRDITERKRAEEVINNLAFYDTLTQLPNRRMLNDRLGQTMAASKRSDFYGALMFLDLDNFKPLNDTHGHGVGDLLLMEVARRITRCVREVDTVARFGGDEFVVVLSELGVDKAESTSYAKIVAEKIRATLSEPYLLTIKHEGKSDTTVEHHCTASIGVVLFVSYEASAEDILKWADAAMYQAKDAGRNLIRLYDSTA